MTAITSLSVIVMFITGMFIFASMFSLDAVLREYSEHLYGVICGECIDSHTVELRKTTLSNTKAAAEKWEAEVRADEREKCAKELDEMVWDKSVVYISQAAKIIRGKT